jgi:O-antigen ligase
MGLKSTRDLVVSFLTDRAWREEKVAGYASIGILFFLTSFFWGYTRDFMQGVYALSFFIPLLLVLLLRPFDQREYGGWFSGLGLLYAGYAAASTLWSPTPKPFFFGLHLLYLAVWLGGTAWLAGRGRLDVRQICRVLVMVGAVAAAVCLVVYPLTLPLGARLELRGWGVARNPNTLALFFGAVSLLAYIRWLEARGWRDGSIAFGLFLLNTLPVLLSQSRGPILALAFALALGFALYRGASRKLAANLLGTVVLATGLFVASQQDELVHRLQDRWQEPGDRPLIWHTLIERGVRDHLLFGEGLERTSRISMPGLQAPSADVPEGFGPAVHHAHSSYIDAFFRTGLVGLILMGLHLLYILWHWARVPQLLPIYLWFVFGCTTSLFDNPGFFWYLDSLWFVYWLPAGLIGAVVMAERLAGSRSPAS